MFRENMLCASWYHLQNLKNMKKNPHRRVLLLLMLQDSTLLMVSFTFLYCTNGTKSRKVSHIIKAMNKTLKDISC